MSKLQEHAKRELELAGLFDKNSDYDGMLGESAMELIEVFSKQGHSGYSAQLTRELFSRLSNYKPLTPITSKPEEWSKVSTEYVIDGTDLWQNKRQSSCFSKDGGKTWYDIDEGKN